MASRIDVDGWVESLDEESLSYPSLNPVLFRREGGDVFFTEVMLVVFSMLEHGRLVVAKGIGGGGKMLFETGADGSLSFTHIGAVACCAVGASTRYVVDMSNRFTSLKLVFRLDEGFSQVAARGDGGTETFGVEQFGEGLGDASKVWKDRSTLSEKGLWA